jgi:hypothetical protein
VSSSGLDVVSVSQVEQAAIDGGVGRRDATEVAASYGRALLDALKRSLFAVAFLALLGLFLTKNLPGRSSAAEPAPRGSPARAAAARRGADSAAAGTHR